MTCAYEEELLLKVECHDLYVEMSLDQRVRREKVKRSKQASFTGQRRGASNIQRTAERVVRAAWKEQAK
jgi:hypothetical protein